MMMRYRILPLLADVVPAAVSACDGVLFDTISGCPHCGGPVVDHDIRTKHFAVILDNNTPHTITVRVKRFWCRQCNLIVYADQPFYPQTRIGSPLVDLCVTFATMMPYARVSNYLQRIGIIVDRWSVRNYTRQNFTVAMTDMHGTKLPVSIVELITLAASTREGTSPDPCDILAACNHPSAKLPVTRLVAQGEDCPNSRNTKTCPENPGFCSEKTKIYHSMVFLISIFLIEYEYSLGSLFSTFFSYLGEMTCIV